MAKKKGAGKAGKKDKGRASSSSDAGEPEVPELSVTQEALVTDKSPVYRDLPASPTATASADASSPSRSRPEDEWPDEATPIGPPPEFPATPDEYTPISFDRRTESSAERRLFRRVPFFRKIQYKFETMEQFKTEVANDLSIGGMFIKTNNPEPLGSVIFLEFDLKDGSKILSGYGKVVRVNAVATPDFDPGMGVEFMKFDEESMTRIKAVIAERFTSRL
jgi:uncharacterized protein (TIGR02266 family)